MSSELAKIIDEISREKNIDREALVQILEAAVLTAARRRFGPGCEFEAHYNPEMGEIELFQFKTVVERVRDPDREISLEEARTYDPEAELGDSLGFKVDAQTCGRIAAQAAKQVIIQRIRDIEGEIAYQEYKDRKGQLVTGFIHRLDRGNVILNLGKGEGILPPQEQVPTETYRRGDRLKCYLLDIKRLPSGTQILLSRTHPQLVVKLFELEVPEIAEGIVRIRAVAREPGVRTKIAVESSEFRVDPVGACVGARGSRVQAVVQELRGERVDIVPYSEDPTRFVCNALLPARVTEVVVDEDARSMEVTVPDDQLSLAIGKRGQNVRLAAKLTGWRIDIRSESKARGIFEEACRTLMEALGVGEVTAKVLFNEGFFSPQDVAEATEEELARVPGVGVERAQELREAALRYLQRSGSR